jgi:TolB-like protein/Tfp pilus assembly protein PilF
LAILPLANATANADLDYLGDGITEGIINHLAQLPGLRVMARSTVFRYQGSRQDPQRIGRELNVRAVLAGRILARDRRLTIRAELVDVADGSQLWGEQYHRELADVQAVETTIAQEIADKLRLRLTGEQARRLKAPRTVDAQAYQCYLKGRYHWNKRSSEGLKRSISYFEQAIEIDPTYALAYAGIADAYLNLGGWGDLPFRAAYPRAKAAATRALEIDGNLAEAHVSLGMVHKEFDWDWAAAGQAYERALTLAPNYATGHQWYGEYLTCLGRFEEGLAELRRAVELDPLALVIHATLGRHGYYFARQYDRAIAQLRQTLEMDERFWVAHLWLALACANVGRLDEALAAAQTARGLDDNLEITAVLGFTLGRMGRRGDAQRLLDELAHESGQRYVSPMISALIAIGLDDHDAAFRWLEKGYQEKSQMLSELGVEAAFDPLRGDPRFDDLLARVGLRAREVV